MHLTASILSLSAAISVVACTTGDYAKPDLQAMQPSEVEAGESREVEISGDNFFIQLRSDIESGDTILDQDFRVLLFHASGIVEAIEIPDVVYVDDNTIRGTLPSYLPSGIFAARVSGPLGDSEIKAEALTVKRLAESSFNEATLVSGVSSDTFDDDDPTLTSDQLEIYFKSTRGPTLDIFASKRESINDPWSAPARVDELSSGSVDNTPDISSDGLTIYLSSDRDGNVDQYISTRATRSDAWSTPQRVDELSSDAPDYSVTTDGSGLHLVMNRILDGNVDLLSSRRANIDAPWDTPMLVSEINTERYEADCVLDPSGLRLLYTLEEAQPGNKRQIYGAERDSVQSPFAPSMPLSTVNTVEDDEDPWISPDLGVIYFSRTSAGGRKDIYMATRTAL